MINNVEEWRDVVGYEGLYKISSKGRVKSYQGRHKKPKILKMSMTTTGYKKVEWENKDRVVSEYEAGTSLKKLAHKYGCGNEQTIKNVLTRENIKIRTRSEQRMKYKYSRVEMVSLFVNGARNVDIAKQLGIPRQLVNTYKYKWRKGEKLC